MNHIGVIIKRYRHMQKMSQKQLAENVCSSKYVYLIEKGERTPSAEMLLLFGDKLRVDLFEYYQYLDCDDPLAVCDVLKKFRMYQNATDFSFMQGVVVEAEKMPDFQREPWSYALRANQIGCIVFQENRYEEAICRIRQILQNVDIKYKDNIYIADLYVLLSTCYQITGDLNKAKQSTEAAYEIIRLRVNIEKYRHVDITVRLNFVTLYYLTGEFARSAGEAESLVEYQRQYNAWSRIHFTYAFLAFSYYRLGKFEEAFQCFRQVIQFLLFYDVPVDVYYIASQYVFSVMAEDKRADYKMIQQLKEKYGNIFCNDLPFDRCQK